MVTNNLLQVNSPALIGDLIRSRRKQLGLSMDDLRDVSGIDTGTISRAENGSIQITYDTAIQLSRALRIPLSELVVSARASFLRHTSGNASAAALEINSQDIEALVTLFRTQQVQAERLIADWLNRLAAQVPGTGIADMPLDFRNANIQLLLLRHSLFRFKINLPMSSALVAIPAMCQLGGDIERDDIQLLLTAISSDKSLFQKLDRQGRDILQRLQSHVPNRIRVIDLAKLEGELGIDLFGALEIAEGVSTMALEANPRVRQTAAIEARLISLYVTIVCWFKSIEHDSRQWLPALRSELHQL